MKLANSPQLLADRIEVWRLRPFAIGSADCLQFVGDCVSVVTGVDYRKTFPSYESEAGAARILAKHGDLPGLLTSVLGEPIPVAWAQRGDVLAGDFGNGMTAAVCLGANCAAVGPDGLCFRPSADATIAWRV